MPEENKEKTQKKRWTLKKVKTRCRTIYWQNFLLTASVVMLTLALLGSAFFALTYSYAIDERSEQMQSKATVVSHMVSSYMENGSLTGLRELADFASNVTDAEFLICNSDGNLLLTTDTTLVNRVLTVPQDVAEGAMSDDTYAVRTTLGDIYEDTHFVVGRADRERGRNRRLCAGGDRRAGADDDVAHVYWIVFHDGGDGAAAFVCRERVGQHAPVAPHPRDGGGDAPLRRGQLRRAHAQLRGRDRDHRAGRIFQQHGRTPYRRPNASAASSSPTFPTN